MNTPTYILYARKSSESEDRQMASIDDQIAVMQQFAKDRDLQVIDVISESKSAKQPGRAGFTELLERIKNGQANGILTWKLNRLARNPVDAGEISWLLQQEVLQHIQTFGSDYKPSDNVLMMQVEFGIANQFVKNLSADVKRGMSQKAKRGWWPSPRVPVGYRHNAGFRRDIDPEIIPDPETFPKVKILWKKLLAGECSVTALKREGDALGLRNHRGNRFSLNAYFGIFSKEFYHGSFHWNDEYGMRTKYQGKHEPTITEEEWNQAQLLLGKHSRATRKTTYDFPFRGPIGCGECGCRITAQRKLQVICTGCKQKYSARVNSTCPKCERDISEMDHPSIIDRTYYHCTKRRGPCSQKSVEAQNLEVQITEVINSIVIPSEFASVAMAGFKRLHKEESGDHQAILQELTSRSQELVARLDNLVGMRADGELNASEFAKARQASETELNIVRKQIDRAQHLAADWIEIASQYVSFAENVAESFAKGDDNTKKSILVQLGSNLTLKDQKLSIHLPKILIALKEAHRNIEGKKGGLEPKKKLVNKGLQMRFRTSNEVLRAELEYVRTIIPRKN